MPYGTGAGRCLQQQNLSGLDGRLWHRYRSPDARYSVRSANIWRAFDQRVPGSAEALIADLIEKGADQSAIIGDVTDDAAEKIFVE